MPADGSVLFLSEDGDDDITEAQLAEWYNNPNARDFIIGGGITGPSAGDITVEAGDAFVLDSGGVFRPFAGSATLTLPNGSGENYVYITFDTATAGSAQWEVTDTKGAGLSNPVSLLHAVVDTSNSTVDRRNTAPDLSTLLLEFDDAAADPSADGEATRNGADVKIHSGGSVRNVSNIGSGGGSSGVDVQDSGGTASGADTLNLRNRLSATVSGGTADIDAAEQYVVNQIDDTDSPYTTQGESVIVADTSAAGVTVELSTADVGGTDPITVVNLSGANAVTVQTEGAGTIDPGGEASKSWATDGWAVTFTPDGTNWSSTLDAEFESVDTAQADITNETFVRATRSSQSNSTTAGTFLNAFDGESKDVRGEFNSSAQFVPDESGEYIIRIAARISSASAGDEERGRVQDVDGSNTIDRLSMDLPQSINFTHFTFLVNLTAGTTYELQVTNVNSSFKVDTGDTSGEIVRSVVS